jgi:hypothetical protein
MHLKPWQSRNTTMVRPADWRLGVTVCIAASAGDRKRLILVSDSKVAFGDFSADEAVVKNIPFVYPWAVLMAGNDISHVKSVLDKAEARIQGESEQKKESLSGASVADILHEELVAERERIIESSIVRKYGFTATMFRDQGKTLCTDTHYNEIIYKIAQRELSLQFLLCGFNADEEVEIWSVSADYPPPKLR